MKKGEKRKMIIGVGGFFLLLALMPYGGGKVDYCPAAGYQILGTKDQCKELIAHKKRAVAAGYVDGKQEVRAAKLHQDYVANEIRAQDKYFNKAIMITGSVAKVSSGRIFNPSILLSTNSAYSVVQMNMADVHFLNPAATKDNKLLGAREKAAILEPGQIIHAVCFGGVTVSRTQILEDCVIQ